MKHQIQLWKVILVCLAWILLACGLPGPVTSTTTVQPASTPTSTSIIQATTAPFPSEPGLKTPVPTEFVPPAGQIRFFLVAIDDQGKSGTPVGCGDSLVEVTQPVENTTQPIQAALEILFSYKTQYVGDSGMYTALYQSDLSVKSVSLDGDTVHVALVGPYQLGGTCDVPRFSGQIEETILANTDAVDAIITLNGQAIEDALSSR
jgi:hypothetical protein